MKKITRVALSFVALPDTELNTFALVVVVCLKNNPLFPALPVAVTALQTLQTAFQNALTAAATGGPMQTAAKNEAREALIVALRQNAACVQSLNLPNVSQVLSSGYDIASFNTASVPLETPVLVALDNSITTELGVELQAVSNARAYHVRYRISNGVIQDGRVFGSTRNVAVTNLTPGTVYTVQVRAIGGSTGYSEWSAALSLMCT